MASQDTQVATAKRDVLYWTKAVFIRLGVLPFLLIVAIVVFTLMSDNFLSTRNLTNVVRQSVYLMIVSLGQMFARSKLAIWTPPWCDCPIFRCWRHQREMHICHVIGLLPLLHCRKSRKNTDSYQQ